MGTTKPQLRAIDGGGRTPPRQILADAIAERDAADKALANANTALAQARRESWLADERLAAATSKLTEARDTAGKNVAEALLSGSAPTRDQTLRSARSDLADAEDDLAAAKAAIGALEAALPNYERELYRAEGALRAAALAVVGSEADVPALIEQITQTHAHLRVLRSQLQFLVNNDLTGDFDPNSGRPNHADRMQRGGPSVTTLWTTAGTNSPDAAEAWEAYVQTLCTNPDAAMPEANDGRAGS